MTSLEPGRSHSSRHLAYDAVMSSSADWSSVRHRCVTNFRDPIERLISLYNFFKFNVKLSEEELGTERFLAVAFAKSASFEEFVSSKDPNVDLYVRNVHFRQLANSCWVLDATKEFDGVCRFVDEMRWYYVCEYPAMSFAWLRRAFDWDLPQIPRENVTRAASDKPANPARTAPPITQ